MAEKTFRSPGFFEQEIDLSERKTRISGTPAGVIGTAEQGPAFVPVTVGSFADFEQRFGSLDPNRFGPYAVNEWLKNRTALTYMRVLGAGANDTAAQISTTQQQGTVANAGFKVAPTSVGGVGVAPGGSENANDAASGRGSRGLYEGAVQFICAKHYLSSSSAAEMYGFPIFSDNDSYLERSDEGESDVVNLVRGVVLLASGTRMMVGDSRDGDLYDGRRSDGLNFGLDDFACTNGDGATFKLLLSSSSGAAFAQDDDIPGVRIISASLNPDNAAYITNVLNTDPTKFQTEEHLLYLDYAVENELASVVQNDNFAIGVLSGSAKAGAVSTDQFNTLFGRFDTRYTTPKTPYIISQPFGNKEYDLFYFETISDGAVANDKYKISIANIRASNNPDDPYGSFEVQVRRFDDTDPDPEVIERYPECTLNPNDDRYIARQIGDKKVYFDFDADNDDERRLVIEGKYPNKSALVRVRMHALVEKGDTPGESVPFGFRGIPVLKTSDSLTDVQSVQLTDFDQNPLGAVVPPPKGGYMTTAGALPDGSNGLSQEPAGNNRMVGSGSFPTNGSTLTYNAAITGSIVPPLPFRFKATRGRVRAPGVALDTTAPHWLGEPGKTEKTDSRYYWGVKTTRVPISSSATPNGVAFSVLDPNISSIPNPLISAYTKFQGVEKLDTLVSGTAKDYFNNNKFSMSRVALYNELSSGHITNVTGTAKAHMKQAVYIRNGVPDSSTYTISDPITPSRNRITMATLLNSSSVHFNRFADYNKFTTIFYGGYDGLNVLDKNNFYMTDRASSSDENGYAGSIIAGGLGLTGTNNANMTGKGKLNNIVFAYRTAAKLMTDEMTVNSNLLAIPGIRDSFITDAAGDGAKENSMILYLMDPPQYDEDPTRLYDDRTTTQKPDVRETAEAFEGRAVDNNYVAAYFPDVVIVDNMNNENVLAPSTIAAVGAIGYNDRVGYPWFAPAGFNRAALDFVSDVDVRLTAGDRDTLYDARINPIAVFPNGGGRPTFVIFGQKTLQMARSALDRVNVRRMLLEVKRQVVGVANQILFEPNTPATRARFVGQIAPLLAIVQAQAGIESFQIICDDSNNSAADIESNKLNGRIILVPTRAIEFISIDFIITNSGVSFE